MAHASPSASNPITLLARVTDLRKHAPNHWNLPARITEHNRRGILIMLHLWLAYLSLRHLLHGSLNETEKGLATEINSVSHDLELKLKEANPDAFAPLLQKKASVKLIIKSKFKSKATEEPLPTFDELQSTYLGIEHQHQHGIEVHHSIAPFHWELHAARYLCVHLHQYVLDNTRPTADQLDQEACKMHEGHGRGEVELGACDV